MLIKYTGKLLKRFGKLASDIACCCGAAKKWYCILKRDGSYVCDKEYDIQTDQMLSEHDTENECFRECGIGDWYCYYDDDYYCSNGGDPATALSGPYGSQPECEASCEQKWYCVDVGNPQTGTKYECKAQSPDDPHLHGPYPDKITCEGFCGDNWYCVVDLSDDSYSCQKQSEGAPPGSVSGPYLNEADCDASCNACEPIGPTPPMPDCPECVNESCIYQIEGGVDGGVWGACCLSRSQAWRWCNGYWEMISDCGLDTMQSNPGTPACTVYPENLIFPDDPNEGQIVEFQCDRETNFDATTYPKCPDCGYSCIELSCQRARVSTYKTKPDCEANCSLGWSCVSTNECIQTESGSYETQSECLNNAIIDCGSGYGACCYFDFGTQGYACTDDVNASFCAQQEDSIFYPNINCGELPAACGEGACCQADGSCSQIDRESCEADGHIFFPGSDCSVCDQFIEAPP